MAYDGKKLYDDYKLGKTSFESMDDMGKKAFLEYGLSTGRFSDKNIPQDTARQLGINLSATDPDKYDFPYNPKKAVGSPLVEYVNNERANASVIKPEAAKESNILTKIGGFFNSLKSPNQMAQPQVEMPVIQNPAQGTKAPSYADAFNKPSVDLASQFKQATSGFGDPHAPNQVRYEQPKIETEIKYDKPVYDANGNVNIPSLVRMKAPQQNERQMGGPATFNQERKDASAMVLDNAKQAMSKLTENAKQIGVESYNGYKRMDYDMQRAAVISDIMQNPHDEALQARLDELTIERDKYVGTDSGSIIEAFKKDGFKAILNKGISGAAEIAPYVIRSSMEGLKAAIPAALAGGGTAAALGQMGPQIALPEELVTVPGAAAIGFSAGMKSGSGAYMYKIEKAMAYEDLIKQGVEDKTARGISEGVGILSAALEQASLGFLLKSTKIGPLLMKQAVKEAGAQIVKSAAKKSIKGIAVDAVSTAGVETGTELMQEGVQMFGEKLAELFAGMKGQELDIISKEEVGSRLVEVGIQSFLSMFVFGGLTSTPGNIISSVQSKKANKALETTTANLNEIADDFDAGDMSFDTPINAEKLHTMEKTVEALEKVVEANALNGTLTDIKGFDAFKDTIAKIKEKMTSVANPEAVKVIDAQISEVTGVNVETNEIMDTRNQETLNKAQNSPVVELSNEPIQLVANPQENAVSEAAFAPNATVKLSELTESKNSKSGKKIFTSVLTERLDKPNYDKATALIKKAGGNYFRDKTNKAKGYEGEFYFTTENRAEAEQKFADFQKAMNGEAMDQQVAVKDEQSVPTETLATNLVQEVKNPEVKPARDTRAELFDALNQEDVDDVEIQKIVNKLRKELGDDTARPIIDELMLEDYWVVPVKKQEAAVKAEAKPEPKAEPKPSRKPTGAYEVGKKYETSNGVIELTGIVTNSARPFVTFLNAESKTRTMSLDAFKSNLVGEVVDGVEEDSADAALERVKNRIETPAKTPDNQEAIDTFVAGYTNQNEGRISKESALAKAYTLIEAIENKDFLELRDRLMSNDNIHTRKLFSTVTGFGSATQKEVLESIKKIAPSTYDKWAAERDKLEASRLESEKQQEFDNIGKTDVKPIKIDGEVHRLKLKDFLDMLIKDGYHLEYANDNAKQFGRFTLNKYTEDLVSEIDVMKVFDGEQRKWIRTTYTKMVEDGEIKAIDDKVEAERVSKLTPEELADEEAIKGLFGFKGLKTEEPKSTNKTFKLQDDLRVYHGSATADLETFNDGTWFTESEPWANAFSESKSKKDKRQGVVYERTIRKNAIVLDLSSLDVLHYATPEVLAHYTGLETSEIMDALDKDKVLNGTGADSNVRVSVLLDSTPVSELLRSKGFDVIKAKETTNKAGDTAVTYKVLDVSVIQPTPSQKSKINVDKSEKEGINEVEGQNSSSEYSKTTAKLASKLQELLRSKTKISSGMLFSMADKEFNGTQGRGTYTPKDAYDALELAVNLHILNDMKDDATVSDMQEILDLLPTQNKRTEEMESFQQFSTPPSIAFLASWVANVEKDDVVLEPSAGIGGLVVFAKKIGAKVFVNEYSKRRLDVIKNMPFDGFFNENAEQLNNILPKTIKPSVVIMNPPFSATAGRMGEKKATGYAKAHIEQALKRLEPNGRLVAIVGQGMAYNTPTFKAWWKELEKTYSIKANIGIDGKNYAKYGTSFDIQMVIIDKTGPTTGEVLVGKVEELSALQDMLGGIRDDRKRVEPKGTESNSTPSNEGVKVSDGRGRLADDTSSDSNGNPKAGSGDNATGDRVGKRGGKADKLEPTDSLGSVDESGGRRSDGASDSGSVESAVNVKQGDSASDSGRNNLPVTSKVVRVKAIPRTKAVKTNTEEVGDDDIYSNYNPSKLNVKGAQAHVTELVESSAMSSVEPPDITYSPKLHEGIVENGILSLAQLENVFYAGQAHEQVMLNDKRKGYFIGDGTGVGKGRQIAGIILDNQLNGRKKAVWFSKNFDLLSDAVRDWTAIGGDKSDITSHSKIKTDAEIKIDKGILFGAYTTLRTPERLEQVIKWLGADFDGVIVFDEAHNMGNALAMKGKRGTSKPSKAALAGIELQNRLPNARIVYVSATAATDVAQFAYADRLGLWGDGTSFRDVRDFVSKITEGGLAAMELMARDLKSMGLYAARSLSFKGVEYATLTHNLTEAQTEMHDKAAEAWQIVLQNIEGALEMTEQNNNSEAKKKALGQFWSSNQRFFNQVMTSMSAPSLIASIKKDLANGESAVIQLVNTNEAAQERAFAKSQEEDIDLEDLDMSPTDILVSYLMRSFPIYQYETSRDENGNLKSEIVTDSEGKAVINREAVEKRDELVADIKMMKMPDNPIDMLIEAFGSDVVAEITGRKRRLVYKVNQKTGRKERVMESWGDAKASADVDNFQNGPKRILVFSSKGDTGKSYHSDLAATNQTKRNHYLWQPGWIATRATQGFGRTHRNNQASAPKMILVTTNLKGQKRFISTIARRLNQMGAITKGQREASGGMFSERDNLEGTLAKDTLQFFLSRLAREQISELDGADIIKKMGMEKYFYDKNTGDLFPVLDDDVMKDMPRFLNRLLNLNGEDQNKVFDEYMDMYEKAINEAIKNGTMDTGLENYKALGVSVFDEQVIHEEKASGAKTKYIQLVAKKPTRFIELKDYKLRDNFEKLVRNKETGDIRILYRSTSKTNEKTGEVVRTFRLLGPEHGKENHLVESTVLEMFEDVPTSEWTKAWAGERAKASDTYEETLHMLTGTLLPVWNKLPTDRTRVMRVVDDKGNSYLGRLVAGDQIDEVLKKFNVKRNKEAVDGNILFNKVFTEGKIAHFDDKVKLVRRRVAGENRIELSGNNAYLYARNLTQFGVFSETISFERRFFVPTDPKMASNVLNELLKRLEFSDFANGKEDVDAFSGKPDSSGKLGITSNPLGINIDMSKPHRYEVGKLEGQHRNSRIKKKTAGEWIKEHVEEAKLATTRHFMELDPNDSKMAEAIKELGLHEKAKMMASSDAQLTMETILHPQGTWLSDEEFNRFERYIELRDLMEDLDLGLKLPGEWTEDSLKNEWARIEGAVNERILDAVTTRDAFFERMKKRYIKAMKAIGVDVSGKFKRKNYFRHMVLEFYDQNEMVRGSGSEIKANIYRGSLKERKGTDKIINADYLQAEYESLWNMTYDTKVAEMLGRLKSEYDITKKLKQQAKAHNKAGMDFIIKTELGGALLVKGASETHDKLTKFNQNLAIAFSNLSKLAEDGDLWSDDGKWEKAIDLLASEEKAEDGGLVMAYLSALADQKDESGQLYALMAFSNIAKREAFIKETLGEKYYEWKQKVDKRLIPDGYKDYQPVDGKHMRTINTVTDNMVDAIQKAVFDNLTEKDLMIKQLLAVGVDRETWIIPEGVANTLEDMYNKKAMGNFEKTATAITLAWKRYVLTVNPKSVIKYNVRNLTGDIDAIFMASGYGSFDKKYTSKALGDIYNGMKHHKFSDDLLSFREKGGFMDNIYVQEIASINEAGIFKSYDWRTKSDMINKVMGAPMAAFKNYTDFTQNLTEYRELVMRYSTYLYFLDKLNKNNGKLDYYSASNRKIIDGLKKNDDKAYKLSKDVCGAYDDLSVFGQFMKKNIAPFWSFTEVNFSRYRRAIINATDTDNKEIGAAFSLRLGIKASAKATIALGKLALRATMFTAAVTLWNQGVMGDEDDELPENVRNVPHITFGRRANGDIMYFSRVGSLNDILDWFGVSEAIQEVSDVLNDRTEFDTIEFVKNRGGDALNKGVQMIHPFLKTAIEMASGQSYFPDIDTPRRIRDMGAHLAQSYGFKDIYARVAGLPVKMKYAETWLNALVYTSNPAESAYYRTLDLKNKFEKLVQKRAETGGFSSSEKSKAAYYWKLAIKYGDEKAEKKFYDQYMELGVQEQRDKDPSISDEKAKKNVLKGMKQSLSWLDPMRGLDDDETEQFMEWLTPSEREDVERGITFYESIKE